jgi:4'-phosphopantetheinyl transferase
MALEFIKNVREGARLGVWRVEESVDALEKSLLLNEEERSFFLSLNKGKRNLHWLASRVLLRTMIDTPEFIEVKNDEHGKPHLINHPFELSFSHSADYAAVLLSKNICGVDIELIGTKIRGIAERFLHSEELEFTSDSADPFLLHIIWGAKEAIFKLHGKRKLSFREHISVSPFKAENAGIVKASLLKVGHEKNFVVHYEVLKDYMLVYVLDES